MFSQKTLELINDAALEEYENAKKNWGEKYHSKHEAWAVLHEEVGEVRKDYKTIKNLEKWLWSSIINNQTPDIRLMMELAESAKHLAMEACEVAAVCRKMSEGAK